MTLDMNSKSCPDCCLGIMRPTGDDDQVYCTQCGFMDDRYPDGKPERDHYCGLRGCPTKIGDICEVEHCPRHGVQR